MDGQATQRSSAARRRRVTVAAAVLSAAIGVGVLAPANPAMAFSKTWYDTGCSVTPTSHGLLDGFNLGSGAVGASFWMNPVSSANESCSLLAGVGKWMSASGELKVRVKIDPRVRFQVVLYGTQGDIACAKQLAIITSVYNDFAFHKLTATIPQGEWVDCVKMFLDDDPNTTPPGGEYPAALIDYVKIRTGLNTVWQESFS